MRTGALAALLAILAPALGRATAADGGVPPDVSVPAEIAIVPFANHAGTSDALTVVMADLRRELTRTGIAFLSDEALRPILRRHRIRSLGRIGPTGARLLADETGVSRLLLGSVDVFEGGANPDVAISLRVLDPETGLLAWAASTAATGEDFAGAFGAGRIDDVEAVAERVVSRAVDGLRDALRTQLRNGPKTNALVGVIAFDDASEHPAGAGLFAGPLTSALVSAGLTVLEPGYLSEILLSGRHSARGAVDYPGLASVHGDLALAYVVTGTVERCEPARGEPTLSVPELEVGARLIDAETGKVVSAFHDSRDGGDSDKILQLGRCHSLGGLAAASAAEIVRGIVMHVERARHDTP